MHHFAKGMHPPSRMCAPPRKGMSSALCLRHCFARAHLPQAMLFSSTLCHGHYSDRAPVTALPESIVTRAMLCPNTLCLSLHSA